jgi:hypothetical protein
LALVNGVRLMRWVSLRHGIIRACSGAMSNLLPSSCSSSPVTPVPVEIGGIARTYPRDETAARNHGDAVPECLGLVALEQHERIGERVWLQRIGGEPYGPLLVVDCAGKGPRPPRWLVEVSPEIGRDLWGMRAPIFVSLWVEVDDGRRRSPPPR